MEINKKKYPDITNIPDMQYYPLSFQQERIWYISQLVPESTIWTKVSCECLKGTIDIQLLEKAVEDLVRRHTVLKIKINLVDNSPVQSFPKSKGSWFEYLDLSSLDELTAKAKAFEYLDKVSETPININGSQLFKAILVKFGEASFLLILTLHHIISDATTFQIIWRDIKIIYNSYLDNSQTLPQINTDYHDYVIWQRETFNEQNTKEQENYWLNEYKNEIPILNLTTDFPPLPLVSFKGSIEKIELPSGLLKKIESLSFKKRVVLFSTLLAAYFILLENYCGQNDLIIGTVFSGRHYNAEIKKMAGFFVNTVAIRMNIQKDISFSEFLNQVHNKINEAYLMQDYPFERLIKKINPDRNTGANPLARASFNIVNNYDANYSFIGIREETCIEPKVSSAQYDISLDINHDSKRMEIRFIYNNEIFKKETIYRMINNYLSLLNSIVNDSDVIISELEFLDSREKEKLFAKWNDNTKKWFNNQCIPKLFEENSKKKPDSKVVICGEQSLTYRELNKRANQLANYLQRLGVGPELPVGIFLEFSIETFVALLGIMKAGGAYVPLDPSLPRQRLAFILKDISIPLILTQQNLVEKVDKFKSQVVCLDTNWETISLENIVEPTNTVLSQNLAYTIYTSGSKGELIGINIEHGQLTNYVKSVTERFNLRSCTNFAIASLFASDFINTIFFPAICTGGCVHILSIEQTAWLSAIDHYFYQHSIDCIKMSSSHISSLLGYIHPERLLPRKCLILDGKAINFDLIKRLVELAPESLDIFTHYGTSETSTGVLTYQVRKGSFGPGYFKLPLGYPLSNTQIYVLNPNLKPVPIGVPGEMFIGGDNLARGYANKYDSTTTKFIENPISSFQGTQLFKTGELVRWRDDGNIEYFCPIDKQIKIRDLRIELEEIESILMQHPAVNETLLIVREGNSGEKYLVAYIVLKTDEFFDSEKFRNYLRNKLPEYMVPDRFVNMNIIPRLPNGKVDYNSLIIPNEHILEEGYVEPRTPTEKKLVTILKDLLKVDHVGINDNFLRLGGHSILAMQAVLRIREIMSVDLPINMMFDMPSVKDLANYIEKAIISEGNKNNDKRETGKI